MILGSPELYQFLLFVLVGCSSAFISFGIYSVLVFLGGHYVVSNYFEEREYGTSKRKLGKFVLSYLRTIKKLKRIQREHKSK